MPKLLAVTIDYPPNRFIGAELAVHRTLQALRDRHGFSVAVETTEPRRGSFERISFTPRRANPLPVCDAVLVNAGIAIAAGKRFSDRPVFIWAHNNQQSAVIDARNALRRDNTWVLANTRHMKDVLRSTLGVRASVLYPPVVAALPERVKGADRIGIVNASPDKGGRIMWELARLMPDRGFLALAGGYGKSARDTGDNVEFVDHGQPTDFWPNVRVLIMPSPMESFSMAAVEAAASGIPVVAVDQPGVREALGDRAWYVDDPNDLEAWATQVDAAWSATLARRRALTAHVMSIGAQRDQQIADLAEAIRASITK